MISLVDAADFEGATIFAEPDLKSGLGGWGHPEDDYLVHDGGFSYDFDLAYPSPHGLRRNYTLRPWESDQFAGLSVILDPSQEANISFTADKIQALVNGHVGDYVGFQFGFEDWEVGEILSQRVSLLIIFGRRPMPAFMNRREGKCILIDVIIIT